MTKSSDKQTEFYPGAYHELQKEPHCKDQVHARVIRFALDLLQKRPAPLGRLPDTLRHGNLPLRKPSGFACRTFRRKLLLFIVVYLFIGIR